MNIVGIKFKGNNKIYCFKNNDLDIKSDDLVVVDTEKGQQLGKVANVNMKANNLDINTMKEVLYKATDKDIKQYERNLKDAKEALKFVKEKVEQ